MFSKAAKVMETTLKAYNNSAILQQKSKLKQIQKPK